MSSTGGGEGITAYVALGSNLGDRDAHLAFAVAALHATPGIEVTGVSGVYETDPVGPGRQQRYLNAALRLETSLPASRLLETMIAIEERAGRRRGAERWVSRTLDLDLLLYGDACIDLSGLEVPHPRLHERAFVLVPLAEIASQVRHPARGETIGTLLTRLESTRGVDRWGRALELPDR